MPCMCLFMSIRIDPNDLYYHCIFFFSFFLPFWLPGAPNAQQWLIVFLKGLWNSSMVCKLFIMTCQTSMNLLDNIYTVFLQNLWGSRFEPMDSPNRTCWTGSSRSSPRFSNLLEPNHKSSSRFRQSVLWTGPNRTAASLVVSSYSHSALCSCCSTTSL